MKIIEKVRNEEAETGKQEEGEKSDASSLVPKRHQKSQEVETMSIPHQ
jgi:hypothetical protein